MQYLQSKNIYKIIRTTGNQNNILGISFSERELSVDKIEIIELEFPNINKSSIRISKDELINQVLSGLNSGNNSLGTNYKLSKIYFFPFDNPANQVYVSLISALIRHYHFGYPFKQINE